MMAKKCAIQPGKQVNPMKAPNNVEEFGLTDGRMQFVLAHSLYIRFAKRVKTLVLVNRF